MRLRAAFILFVLPFTQAFLPSSIKNAPNRATVLNMSSNNQNIVVISPPGGVGEVAAVKAAQMGSSVKWFVVSPPSLSGSASAVELSSETLESISETGSLELAGADAETLLLPMDDPSSALKAVSTWCSSANGIICTVDGIEEAVVRAARQPGVGAKQMEQQELDKVNNLVSDAIKVAAKEASSSPSTMKVAVMSVTDVSSKNEEEEEEEGGKNIISSFFGGNKVDVPSSLSKAMKANGSSNNFATLRYGELFGIPESSVSFCIFYYFFVKKRRF